MNKKKDKITIEDMDKKSEILSKEKEIEKTSKATSKKAKTAKAKSTTKKKPADNKELDKLKTQLNEINDKYLRLSAEYDNYRKRTLKEKMELTKTGGENILINILPVVDDFDRAMKSMENVTDCNAMKEGIELIYNKFIEFLKSRGVKEIEAINKEFNTDIHEAITKIPAPNKKLKGKVVDVIEKGYYLYDKVMRYSKVVIGE